MRKVGRFLSYRANEIILGGLLTVAIAFFGVGIRAQATLQERVTENALEIAVNKANLQAACDQFLLLSKLNDEALTHGITDLKERLDQRCDTLENLLSLIYEAKNTGE